MTISEQTCTFRRYLNANSVLRDGWITLKSAHTHTTSRNQYILRISFRTRDNERSKRFAAKREKNIVRDLPIGREYDMVAIRRVFFSSSPLIVRPLSRGRISNFVWFFVAGVNDILSPRFPNRLNNARQPRILPSRNGGKKSTPRIERNSREAH